MHRSLDFGGGLRPDFDLLLATLVVGDDAALELCFDLFRFLFVAVENLSLGFRGLHIVDRHGDSGLRRVTKAEIFQCVE